MSLERQLARAEALAATLAAARQERSQAVLAALAVLKVYCRDPVVARALAIAWAVWEELNERPHGPEHPDVVETVRMYGGIRPAARALGVAPSTISRRLARVLRDATPCTLPLPKQPRTVGTVVVMDQERGGGAGLLIHRAAPADLQPKTGGDQAMLGSKGPELISPQAALPMLFERLERLERLPANAEEAAKQQAERLQIRRRLAEERFALIDALAREGIAIARRVEKALHVLDHASGPAARAAAQGALQTVLLEQTSNSCAQELRPAALAKELARSADPAWKEAQAHFEREMEANRAFFPPFLPTTDADKKKMRAEAEAAPMDPDLIKALRNGDRAAVVRFGQNIITIPFLHGGFDQDVLHSLRQRSAVLKAAHLYCREEGPLLPLAHAEVMEQIARRKASIPAVPAASSTGMFPIEGIESRPAPATVAEGTFVAGVRQ